MRGILNYFMPATGEKRAMKTPIYFDYSATTPVDERVAAKMAQFLTRDGVFGNPASRSHDFGWRAEEAVEDARRHVADLLAADPREIVWTSGATESNNLALKGAARFNQKKGKHILTIKTEHKAVLDTVRELEREGLFRHLSRPRTERAGGFGQIPRRPARRHHFGFGDVGQQ